MNECYFCHGPALYPLKPKGYGAIFCCSSAVNKCPERKRQNSLRQLNQYKNGRTPHRAVGNKANSGKAAWNIGLTTESDPRLKEMGQKIALQRKENPFSSWDRCSTETKEKVRAASSAALKADPSRTGYKPGSGIGKSGWFQGVWCDSSWELAWVMYAIDHGIKFKRNTEKFPYTFEGKVLRYIPDFLLEDGTFLEIKGRETDQWIAKQQQFQHPLIVIGKNDISPFIDYAVCKYGRAFIKMYSSR